MKHLLLLLTMSVALMANGQVINSLPYTQSFDDTTIPEFWTQVDHQGDGQIWQFGTDESTGPYWDFEPMLNGNYAIVNSDVSGGVDIQNVDLVSPTFNLSGYSNVNLQFKHFFYAFMESAGTLSYSIDNGGSWTEITNWYVSSTNPEIFSQVIPEIAGQSQVKFKWNYVGEDAWGWAVDDVTVSEITSVFWEGFESSDWNNPLNWSSNSVPGASADVQIWPLFGPFNPVIQNQGAECYRLSIDPATTLTINPGMSLSVYDELINNASNGLIIKSDGVNGTGSLIAGSVSGTGTAVIERFMTQNRWYYVGAPVDQPISDFLSNNADIPTKDVVSRGMMNYNTSLDDWNPFFTNSKEGTLGIGNGYAVRTTSDTHITFRGTITESTVAIPLMTDGNGWNFVGNPYPSAIKLNFQSGVNSFLAGNIDKLDPFHAAVYYWDGTEYQIVNDIQPAEYATVGQGFFVKSIVDGEDIIFQTDMQVHQPTVALKSAVVIPGIKLLASTSKKNASTDIKFHKKGTTGLDVGYDAGTFKADPSFSVFTKLVDENNVNFGLQCLPILSAETMIVPVGINFPEGGEVTFKAQLASIPEKANIILEDRLLNTSTSLNEVNGQYTTTVEANSMPTGRFYLHVSGNEQVTGIKETVQNKINAWTERDEIVIKGISENNAVAKLFDIRGSSVLVKNLDKSVTNRINVNGITSGIYMLQVIENGKRTGIKLQITGK